MSSIDAGKLINKISGDIFCDEKLTPNIVFCKPKGIGVRRAKSTTRKALGPDITRRIARPVSVFINLCKKRRKEKKKLKCKRHTN